jgi:hypothetical protein
MYTNPTGSFPPIQLIDKRDWVGEPTVEIKTSQDFSFVEGGGVAYSGSTTGTFDAFLSQAPGAIPLYRGKTDSILELKLSSQSQLNEITGNLLANKNAKFPSIDLSMAGNFRQFDIAPLSTVDIDIAVADTNLGQAIHAPYLIDSMNWSYSSQSKVMLPNMGLISLVNSTADGETITIPDAPEGGGYSDFGGTGFGGNFNPGAFPPFVSTLFGGAIWQGRSDLTLAGSGGQVGTFQDFTTTLTNGNIVGTPTGTATPYPTMLQPGIYLIHGDIYSGNTSISAQGMWVGINGADLTNFYNITVKEPISHASSPYIDPIDKTRFAYMNSGDTVYITLSVTKGTATSHLYSLRLTIVKIG